jgi:hypothetical protein
MAKVTKETLDKLVGKVKDLVVDARKLKGFWAVLRGLPALGQAAARVVEDASRELGIKGADKKELALDIVFAYVELPWWIPEATARYLAGRAIEAGVRALKKATGDAP